MAATATEMKEPSMYSWKIRVDEIGEWITILAHAFQVESEYLKFLNFEAATGKTIVVAVFKQWAYFLREEYVP